MLKIIMGSERTREFTNKKFIEFPSRSFKAYKKSEWFEDTFVREIIEKIDNARMVSSFAVESLIYDAGYSVDDISGGSKALILIYKLRDYICLATMGDNCTDFMERIALDYEREGKDLWIVSNYLHLYNFRYVKDIEYVNWGIVCHSRKDIIDLVEQKWIAQEHEDFEEEEMTDEEMERLSKHLIENYNRLNGIKGDNNG